MSTKLYQQINLYQPIFRKQRHIFSALTMLETAGIVAVALLTIYFYGLWQIVGLEAEAVVLEGREKAYSTQLARLDPSASDIRRREVEEELARLNSTLLEQQKLIEVLRNHPLGSTDGFSSYLAALARRHSSGLWLTRVSIDGASGAIELMGQTTDAGMVPAYLLRLGQEEVLAGQLFDRFEIERAEQAAEIFFRVSSQAASGATWQEELTRR